MSAANGHRWSKFWWQDWANDPALRACSLAARGLWMALLCIMHEANPRGYLLMNGQPPTARQLASITGATLKELSALLAELKAARVYSIDPEGWIYSRRMVKDTAASEKGYETGKRGGNPELLKKANGRGTGDRTHPPEGVNHPHNPYPYPQGLTKPLSPTVNLEADSEKEAEEEPTPTPSAGRGGTPAEPGTPQAGRRANGTNPRAEGTNPRNLGLNPRAQGTNPRSQGTNPRAMPRQRDFASGGIAIIAERLAQRAAAQQDDDLTDENSYFRGLKIVEGGHG